MKLVSILILSYRNMDGIYETLDSIFSQDYPEIELVLSDDASPDYAEKQPAIAKYIAEHRSESIREVTWKSHPENVGTVRNSNDAVRLSHGDYLFSLSAEDCFANEHSLRHLVDALEDSGEKIIFGKLRGLTPDGEHVDYLISCESDYDLLKSYTVEQTRNRLFARDFLPGPCAFMKRELFDENGLYPEDYRIIEDYTYWLILTQNGVRFAYLDEVVVEYKLSGVSSTGNYSEMFMDDMFKIYDKLIFPYDHRYGIFQKIYNLLKYNGLLFYQAKSRWDQYSPLQRVWKRIRFLPFFVYTGLQNWQIDQKNKRSK